MIEPSPRHVWALRRFAAEQAAGSDRGRAWLDVLTRHRRELVRLWLGDPGLREAVNRSLPLLAPFVDRSADRRLDRRTAKTVTDVLNQLDRRGDAGLQTSLRRLRRDLPRIEGASLQELLHPR